MNKPDQGLSSVSPAANIDWPELRFHHLMPGQKISRRNIRMQMQRLLAAR